MDTKDLLAKILATEAPLARQMLMAGLITRVLEDGGKPAPVLVGGLALSYYTREVYFTADIELAYVDGDALDAALRDLDFVKKGRYWVHRAWTWLLRLRLPRSRARMPHARPSRWKEACAASSSASKT